jgi:hypothetical protein
MTLSLDGIIFDKLAFPNHLAIDSIRFDKAKHQLFELMLMNSIWIIALTDYSCDLDAYVT